MSFVYHKVLQHKGYRTTEFGLNAKRGVKWASFQLSFLAIVTPQVGTLSPPSTLRMRMRSLELTRRLNDTFTELDF